MNWKWMKNCEVGSWFLLPTLQSEIYLHFRSLPLRYYKVASYLRNRQNPIRKNTDLCYKEVHLVISSSPILLAPYTTP